LLGAPLSLFGEVDAHMPMLSKPDQLTRVVNEFAARLG
jgi:hypothetical protein